MGAASLLAMYPKEVTGAEAARNDLTEFELCTIKVRFGSSSELEFSNNVAMHLFASLKTFQRYPGTSDMRVRARVRLVPTTEVATGYSYVPLLQYKPCYPSPFTILLSMAICRKKSLFG